MNINPPSSRRLLVLTLVLSFALPTLGTYNTSATQGTNAELLAKADGAVRNAQNEFILAESKKLDAEARLEELQKFSDFAEPDNSSLQKIGSLARAVDRMFEPGSGKTLQKQLDDAVTALNAASTRLNSVKSTLDGATSTDKIETEKIESAKSAVSGKIEAIAALKTELTTSKTNLNTALDKIYGQVTAVATTADNRLKLFNPSPPDAPAILSLFQTKLPEVPSLLQFQVDLQESWNNLSAMLANVVDGHAGKADKVNAALTTLKASVEAVVQKINVPVTTLASDTEEREKTLFGKSNAFTKNPAEEERNALRSIQESRRHADALDKIAGIVASVITQAELSVAGFNKTKATEVLDAFNQNTILLRRRSAVFDALLTGDRSLWTTEKIRLYYFTDIPRLIQTLNPDARLTGGDPSARQRAEDRLDKLRAAEDAQTEANGNVSSLKRRVLSLQQELRQANAELNAAKILSQSAGRKHAELERRSAGSVPPERMARSLEEKNAREQDLLAAQERADRLNDQTNGLAAQLRDAEAQLEIAQAAFERASSATIRAAQVESTAFANARDNAPFWFAEGLPTNTDPARRVDITSSTNGENAIFLRGRKEDILKVQDIVAKLDEPAPQARMTLWKIELNSDATKKGAERFNDALMIVEKELANTRAKIADTLSLLLGSVSEQAELAAMNNIGRQFVRRDCQEAQLYRQLNFPGPSGTDITGRLQRLRRYSLYSEQVRKELGIDFIDELGFDNPKQFGLKDPASATTLNEALIILLLTDRTQREQIMDRFEKNLRQNLLNNAANKDEKKAVDKRQGVYLKRLRSMLGLNEVSESSKNFQTTRQQQELIYAMRGPLLKHLVGRIVLLQSRVPAFMRLNGKTKTDEEKALYKCLYDKLPLIFDTIHDEFPISPLEIVDGNVKLFQPGDGTIGLQLYDDNRLLVGTKIYNLRPSPARVAAADGMLDVFTKAFEDDIDREYVQPMLYNLRKQLKQTGIGFGVIQRTSVLATNRLVARVDPRATSELSVGEETNLLQGLQSISQIALAAQTGNVLGGLAQLKASAAQEKDAAEIYGITSGSAFQVTPIFDPTGQALRFKFDFVDTTLVREPRGTTNPRLPRVERHTVNTEVQLANLEIREVSRFESDAKVGLPTTYRGGLPILKDIPGVRPIPLIGWFIRRKGSNAIAQRSLIFAQTTMSPTIGDLLDLFDTSLQRR